IPQLINLQQKIAAPSLVHLRGSASLPAGFAFGQSFLEVGRYQLQIDQFSNGIVQPWYSDVYKADTTFAERLLPGNSISKEAAVIIFANPKQNVEAVVQDVNHYLAQANVSFQQALLLEAEAASKEKRGLTNGEAMALALASAERVGRLTKQGPFEKIHLFMAVPLGLAVFMGHQWNIINSTVQCYEWVGGSDIYAPAGLFHL
ncbi:MAG TPA: SAVED domain-containing protein, partial [Anaerolineae bacterium]|nr:SAVED domain-containing protein [Anaerolineae bacterium]